MYRFDAIHTADIIYGKVINRAPVSPNLEYSAVIFGNYYRYAPPPTTRQQSTPPGFAKNKFGRQALVPSRKS